jgi:hypothetical protein
MAGCGADRAGHSVTLQPPAITPAEKPSQGGSWQAVLPGAVVSGLLGPEAAPGWVESRRDSSLTPRPIEPLLASEAWPEPRRPSLERPRFVRVVRSPEGFIHYRVEQRYEF